jgi:hypothetical protein
MLTVVLPLLVLLMFFGVELSGYTQQLERLQNVTDDAARAALRYSSLDGAGVQRVISNLLDLNLGHSPQRSVSVIRSESSLSVEVQDRYQPKLLIPFVAESEGPRLALSIAASSRVRLQRPSSTVIIDTVGSQGDICSQTTDSGVFQVATEFVNQLSRDPRNDMSVWLLTSGLYGELRRVRCDTAGCNVTVDQDDCAPVGEISPRRSMQRLLEFLVTREQNRSLNLPTEIRESIGMEQVFYFSQSLSSEIGSVYGEENLLREELNQHLSSRRGNLNLVSVAYATFGDVAKTNGDGRILFSPVVLSGDVTPATLTSRLMSLHAVELVSR